MTADTETWRGNFEHVELEPPREAPRKGYINGRASAGGEEATPATPLAYKMLDELKLNTAPFWLIDGYLCRSPMMMIYGPAGSGKTYLGVSITFGLLLAKWFGRAAEPGSVLIFAFERHDDSADRLAALRDRHELMGKGLPLALVDMTGRCLDDEAEAGIIATAKDLAAKTGKPTRIILIDTLVAAIGGRDNGPELLGQLRAAGERIAAATGAIVCWVHHEGKTTNNGPTGHLDLANSCSTWWRVEEREDGSRIVHVDKANRGPAHVPLFAFKLVPFLAGRDDADNEIWLCDVAEVALDGALASPARQLFGKPRNDKPAAGQGSLQKLLVTELRKLTRRHPDGVAKDLLKSEFVLMVAERNKAKGGPPLTAQALTRKFNQTLGSMLKPAVGDPLVEENEDGTLAPGEGL